MVKNVILALVAVMAIASGCRKKPDPVTVITPVDSADAVAKDGHLEISFENMVGNQPLQMNGQTYTNEAGNEFAVTAYKYYISNVKLWKADNSYIAEKESYHLINEGLASSKTFLMHDFPLGEYVAISFIIGVDAERNTSGAQTGALDPANAMFWDWNTGYIMTKMEGTFAEGTSFFTFHTGGFEGNYSVLKEVKLDLPEAAKVNGTKTSAIHIKSDILEWFKTPAIVDLNSINAIASPGKEASGLATNYADMFTIDHVEN